jgi:photoactive yellow protein
VRVRAFTHVLQQQNTTNARDKLQEAEASIKAATIDFNAPDLAARIERLSQYELDRLAFGVILLDREGTVLFYSETEARQSGYAGSPMGKNFFAMSRCIGMEDLRSRILRARETGPVDLEFGWPSDYTDAARELRIRVQSSHQGGFWICIERDGPSP